MRIAYLVGEFPALSVTFIINQIAAMIDRGHEVDIYPSRRGPTDKVHEAVERYRLLERTHFPPPLPASYTARLAGAMRILTRRPISRAASRLRLINPWRHGAAAASLRLLYAVEPFLPGKTYDVIHCHFAVNALRAVAAREAGLLEGKLLTTFHGYDVHTYPRRRGVDVYRRLFATGDLYTANSTFTAEQAIALGCPRERIVRVPVPVDLSFFSFRPRTPGPDGEVRVLTVARLVEKKGIEFAIRAVAQVLPDHPHVRYAIVGDGPLRPELQRLIDDLGVGGQVELLGAKTEVEVRRLYDESHLFILSSVTAADGDQEGQGLVLQEAQAMGLPVLSTLHNGIPDGVRNGRSGFLVPERDVDALSERLRHLIEHPETWADMGGEGRAFVEEHFNAQRINDRIEGIYRDLSEPRP